VHQERSEVVAVTDKPAIRAAMNACLEVLLRAPATQAVLREGIGVSVEIVELSADKLHLAAQGGVQSPR
jgi:hypothetical protein